MPRHDLLCSPVVSPRALSTGPRLEPKPLAIADSSFAHPTAHNLTNCVVVAGRRNDRLALVVAKEACHHRRAEGALPTAAAVRSSHSCCRRFHRSMASTSLKPRSAPRRCPRFVFCRSRNRGRWHFFVAGPRSLTPWRWSARMACAATSGTRDATRRRVR